MWLRPMVRCQCLCQVQGGTGLTPLTCFVCCCAVRIRVSMVCQRLGDCVRFRPIFRDARHYSEAFDKQDIVYLSADATNTVESVDPSKVYVIGGIVDRNRYPGRYYGSWARDLFVRTACVQTIRYLHAFGCANRSIDR